MGEALRNFFEHLFVLSNPLWLYYPLCAVAAVVYKATKYDDPRKIARSALHFFGWVTLGLFTLMLALYLVVAFF